MTGPAGPVPDGGGTAGDPSGVVGTGDRVRVRPWRQDEAAVLLDVLSRPEVTRWLGEQSRTPLTELGQAAAKIAGWAALGAGPGPEGVWAVEELGTGRPVGTVLLMRVPEPTADERELGWYLHPDAQGRGLITEAAGLVVAHAVRHGLSELWAQMQADNAASARVAQRLGMTDLGVVDGLWRPGPSRLFVRALGPS